ncbi:ribosomal RNA processing protein 1 homolog A isoform X2 [Erinaceus europaeus]|uniref:Ribosomal RNA processing protein 1 homolog A isoform X2 n=1 Tax=Erinaceus europaeus TaxID=9365 RepID=A0ABM3Y124_ERIEU|nr:ribosomal RNA processing protein 1 homolog A isoform X2 [Erinaceus europaeus]
MAPAGVRLPPEIQLAQRLAGNEPVTRDRALRRLRKYIVARTQPAAGGFTHEELLKVWKGLFYCMWMQDKPLLQEDLGRTIARLVHAFQTNEAQLLFLQTFWQTLSREWTGLDRLRLDKFYSLMRLVLRESLRTLQMRGWEERHVEQHLELLTTELLHPDSPAPKGVQSHFLEIFLQELSRVGAKELTAQQNLRLIQPFLEIAARTRDRVVLHGVTGGILEAVVEQAPLAIEDLMRELDTQDGEARAAEEEEESEEEEEEEFEEDSEEETGPVLQFDYEALAGRLFEAASQQDTPSQNRKRLYKVVRKLQQLAEGLFPEDELPDKVCRRLQAGRRERKAGRKRRRAKARPGRTGGGEEHAGPAAPRERRSRAARGARGRRGPGAQGPEPERKKRRGSRGRGRPA